MQPSYSPPSYLYSPIKRAELLDTNPKDRWPQGVGTRVYLLAKSIINKE